MRNNRQAGEPWTALVKNRRKNGDHCWVRVKITPMLEAGRVTCCMSVRTATGRDEVAAVEALYAQMRQEASSGRLLHTLSRGELRIAGWAGTLARWLRPGLAARLMLIGTASARA